MKLTALQTLLVLSVALDTDGAMEDASGCEFEGHRPGSKVHGVWAVMPAAVGAAHAPSRSQPVCNAVDS